MAARKLKTEVRDPRPELVKGLKAHIGKYDDYQNRIGLVLQEVWRDTHRYVDVTVTMESHKNTTAKNAIERLARLLHRKPGSVSMWYYHGQFVAKNGLFKADRRAVSELWHKHNGLTKYELAKALDVCKKLQGDEALDGVRRILRGSSGVAKKQGESKASRLMHKKDQWTERRMRMELLALKTLLQRFYGTSVTLACYQDDDQEPVLEV